MIRGAVRSIVVWERLMSINSVETYHYGCKPKALFVRKRRMPMLNLLDKLVKFTISLLKLL